MRKSTPEDTLTRDSLGLAKLSDDCFVVLIEVQDVPLVVFLLPAALLRACIAGVGSTADSRVLAVTSPADADTITAFLWSIQIPTL